MGESYADGWKAAFSVFSSEIERLKKEKQEVFLAGANWAFDEAIVYVGFVPTKKDAKIAFQQKYGGLVQFQDVSDEEFGGPKVDSGGSGAGEQ